MLDAPDAATHGTFDGVEVVVSKDGENVRLCPFVIVKAKGIEERRVYVSVGCFDHGLPSHVLENLTRTERGRMAVRELLACMLAKK